MTGPDEASRARHPSSPGVPVDPPSGDAGPAVRALLPRGARAATPVGRSFPDPAHVHRKLPRNSTPATLRRQRRRVYVGASVVTLVLVVCARVAPTAATWLAVWVLAACGVLAAWIVVCEVARRRTRRRRWDERREDI